MIQRTTLETLRHWIQNDQVCLVDVRGAGEHQAQNIPGSISLPLDTITADQLQTYTSKNIVLYCQTGQRSDEAFKKLETSKQNLNLSVLENGLDAWKKAGYEINQQAGFYLPLHRQVQMTIGLLVLITSVLAYTYDIAFILLTGFFGAGLMLAGLTGFCGLARMMEKMPWNQTNA